MHTSPFSVQELNAYLKLKIESDQILQDLHVAGEISNFKHHSSGHIYFTLKDPDSEISCAFFKNYNNTLTLPFTPENGMQVVCRASVNVYAPRGVYQLIIKDITPVGKGSLQVAFEQLKKAFEHEGYFDESRKRPLPAYPKTIGVVTSPTSAAIQDILHILRRRHSNIRVLIAATPVQGEGAAAKIADAIDILNEHGGSDVIIVGRGGGSMEDLWEFNVPAVAHAIFRSHIPVISAVGHETDNTISDFVADVRAPTPSAAAELVVRDKTEMIRQIQEYAQRLHRAVSSIISDRHQKVSALSGKIPHPMTTIHQHMQYTDELHQRIILNVQRILDLKQHTLGAAAALLNALSPLSNIGRGYCIAETKGQVIRSIRDVEIGDIVTVTVSDGYLGCKVQNKQDKVE